MAGDTSADARIERDRIFEVADADSRITVAKIYTPKGERLEFRAEDGAYIRLDAIELESLSWQDRELFDRLRGESGTDEDSEPPDSDDGEVGEPVRVSNEYSEVVVREVTGPDWDAVIVNSEPLHYENLLRPRELRAVVDQDHELFSELLNEPYGPLKE